MEYFLHSPASRNPRYQQNQRHCVQADELCPKSSFPGIRQEWMIETPRPRVADNVWNTSAYKAYGMKRPWYYFGERCVRTLVHGFGELVGRDFAREVRANFEGTPHDALDDGKHQIRYLMPARNAVGGLGRMSDVFLPSPTQSSTDSGEDKPVISKSTFWTSEPAKSPVRKSVDVWDLCSSSDASEDDDEGFFSTMPLPMNDLKRSLEDCQNASPRAYKAVKPLSDDEKGKKTRVSSDVTWGTNPRSDSAASDDEGLLQHHAIEIGKAATSAGSFFGCYTQHESKFRPRCERRGKR